jgi:hypothetical protein
VQESIAVQSKKMKATNNARRDRFIFPWHFFLILIVSIFFSAQFADPDLERMYNSPNPKFVDCA